MKKVLIILIALITITSINSVYALSYYDSVNITAVFSEEVDPYSIDTITVSLGLPTEEEKVVELKLSDSFSKDIIEIPKGNIEFLYGIVDDDRLSEYTVTGNVIKTPNNSDLEIKIVVSKTQNNEVSSKDLTEDQYNIIQGGKIKSDKDYGKILVKNEDGTYSYKSKDNQSTDDEQNDNGLDIDLSEDNTTITTKKIEVNKTSEEIKQEREEKRIKEKNSIIAKILFTIIGVVLLCAVVFASVKIMNANK